MKLVEKYVNVLVFHLQNNRVTFTIKIEFAFSEWIIVPVWSINLFKKNMKHLDSHDIDSSCLIQRFVYLF